MTEGNQCTPQSHPRYPDGMPSTYTTEIPLEICAVELSVEGPLLVSICPDEAIRDVPTVE
jgi:hypothetical protein